jgi:hypothetical protein
MTPQPGTKKYYLKKHYLHILTWKKSRPAHNATRVWIIMDVRIFQKSTARLQLSPHTHTMLTDARSACSRGLLKPFNYIMIVSTLAIFIQRLHGGLSALVFKFSNALLFNFFFGIVPPSTLCPGSSYLPSPKCAITSTQPLPTLPDAEMLLLDNGYMS